MYRVLINPQHMCEGYGNVVCLLPRLHTWFLRQYRVSLDIAEVFCLEICYHLAVTVIGGS
jgi:hypothetical protein